MRPCDTVSAILIFLLFCLSLYGLSRFVEFVFRGIVQSLGYVY